MERVAVLPRDNWQQKVESQGLLYHTSGENPYWDESVYYRFTQREIETLEAATLELNDMCLEAVQYVISKKMWEPFGIPPEFAEYAASTWETDELTVYGRFDLCFDGNGPPKLLEYNADTPTALLEAAVVQWFWFKDLCGEDESLDQFNSIHERLIEAWTWLRNRAIGYLHFASMADQTEDFMTVNYLRDTAMQAGFETKHINVEDIGWNAQQAEFVDIDLQPLGYIFKLYPWEWLIRDEYGRMLLLNKTRWFEPSWKMFLSNKAILAVLWQLFPDSEYLLRTEFQPFSDTYVRKPILAREGANIAIVQHGITMEQTGGSYSNAEAIYQEFSALPILSGHYPVIGSWMVNGHACGIGIRESDGLITGNTSRFVPHLFVKDKTED